MSKTVMIVDDSGSFRTVVKLALQKAGYGVVEAVDGKDAVGKLNDKRRIEVWRDARAVFAAPLRELQQAWELRFRTEAQGAWTGFAYSWIGTMVSALVGFYLGRFAGARALQTLSGESMQRFMDMVGRNGFLASLIVRLVPSAPFIVVNMAAGVTPMRVSQFLAGTALGIIPKIAVTAFAGNSIVKALKGEGGGPLVWLALAAISWLAIGWFARRWLKSREAGAGDLDS